MSSASGIAQSGLLVAALSIDVSANNVANALTEDFTPSRVVAADVAGGGVTAGVEPVPDASPGRDPMDEVRADRALLVPDRVDLVQELVNQARAAAVYKANLATLRTATELEETLVDALGK
jgi:flagellar basal body rod protein FlgC